VATVQRLSTMSTPLLVYGYTIKYEAISATTGATVSGVKVTNPNLTGINLSVDTPPPPVPGPFQLLPLDEQPQGET